MFCIFYMVIFQAFMLLYHTECMQMLAEKRVKEEMMMKPEKMMKIIWTNLIHFLSSYNSIFLSTILRGKSTFVLCVFRMGCILYLDETISIGSHLSLDCFDKLLSFYVRSSNLVIHFCILVKPSLLLQFVD